ncbi:hypothetical protein [Acinetobacter rudis]|uniref:Lipoprotein n=1 Tax=Acinetobacter rudis TaxID=632955 RepID=A0AAW8J6P2_9GAMM|nr:hypothetical protein [Acinetobacter rudis]MDQ8935243.1 hypothetical protein [Acinetobacter rudis]MDQ9017562.1 hypothetical protein [Acinetobacter rudis]
MAACSTYPINSHSNNAVKLDDRAVQGLNAMYNYPNYDFNGRFNVNFAAEKKAGNAEKQVIDAKLKSQLDQYIAAQNIKLSKQEKADLYEAIAGRDSSGRSDRAQQFLSSFLKHTQFGYEGSIDFRERLATFDFSAKYEKQTLLVQTKVPMALDLKNHKFYINYFGVMPFMVNQENQDNYAYVDFSEYKDIVDKIDYKNLVTYLQENTAVPYLLANPEKLQRQSLSAADKSQGVVEKIRLKSSLEEFMLQQNFFEAANRGYVKHSVIDFEKVFNEKLEKMTEEASKYDEDKYSTYGMGAEEAEAYKASTKLYRLVNEKLHDRNDESEALEAEEAHVPADYAEDDVVAASAAATDSAADAAAADVAAARAAEDDREEGLSEEQCEALRDGKQRFSMGDVTYCQEEHYVYLLPSTDEDIEHPFKLIMSDKYEDLVKKFEASGSEKLITAAEFKQLWADNSTEIKALLATQKPNDFVVDVGLDEKGRAVKVDYDVDMYVQGMGTFKLNSDNHILNYGQAKKISRSQFKNAKSIEEVTKDSPFEYMIGSLTRALGNKGSAEAASGQSVKSFDRQLEELAARIYDSTGSYSKVYEAVFLMMLSHEKPQIVQYYTPRELSEIARVYAYSYADQDIYDPQGKELAELEKLEVKHKLERRDQFADRIGSEAYDVTTEAMEKRKDRQAWNKFVAQYKQPKTVFAQYYMQQFIEGEDLNTKQKAQLKRVSEILAQTYLDARKDQLTAKSIVNITEDDEEFIDYSLYSEVYEKVASHFKK